MELKEILEAVKLARQKTAQRKFKQTFDLIVSFRDLDLKNPANKIKDSVLLPHGRGKPIRIAAFADSVTAENAKKAGVTKVLDKLAIQKVASSKKEAKKLANQFDFFIAQTDLMVEVGKTMGAILGPRNKMPQPVPPNAPLEPLLKRLEKVVNFRVVNQPFISCMVGTEALTDDQIADNVNAVISAAVKKLPKHEINIKNIFVKTTMGPIVKIGAKLGAAEKGGETQ